MVFSDWFGLIVAFGLVALLIGLPRLAWWLLPRVTFDSDVRPQQSISVEMMDAELVRDPWISYRFRGCGADAVQRAFAALGARIRSIEDDTIVVEGMLSLESCTIARGGAVTLRFDTLEEVTGDLDAWHRFVECLCE